MWHSLDRSAIGMCTIVDDGSRWTRSTNPSGNDVPTGIAGLLEGMVRSTTALVRRREARSATTSPSRKDRGGEGVPQRVHGCLCTLDRIWPHPSVVQMPLSKAAKRRRASVSRTTPAWACDRWLMRPEIRPAVLKAQTGQRISGGGVALCTGEEYARAGGRLFPCDPTAAGVGTSA